MKAVFEESVIDRIYVNGNGESIYYVLDDNNPNDIFLLGMNRILCSNMTIRLVAEEVDNISFYTKPEAKFIPPNELTEEIQRLRGFSWRSDERPTLEDVLQDSPPLTPPSTDEEEEKVPPPPGQEFSPEGIEKKKLLKNIKSDG